MADRNRADNWVDTVRKMFDGDSDVQYREIYGPRGYSFHAYACESLRSIGEQSRRLLREIQENQVKPEAFIGKEYAELFAENAAKLAESLRLSLCSIEDPNLAEIVAQALIAGVRVEAALSQAKEIAEGGFLEHGRKQHFRTQELIVARHGTVEERKMRAAALVAEYVAARQRLLALPSFSERKCYRAVFKKLEAEAQCFGKSGKPPSIKTIERAVKRAKQEGRLQ